MLEALGLLQEVVSQSLKLLGASKGRGGSFLLDSNTTPIHLWKRILLGEQRLRAPPRWGVVPVALGQGP